MIEPRSYDAAFRSVFDLLCMHLSSTNSLFHQLWHWEICWPFNQILSEVTLLAALRLERWSIFCADAMDMVFFSLRCEIINWISNLSLQSLPSILSQMPVDAKYQRLELCSIKKKISMPTAFQIQGKPNWFSLLPPLSLFAARFLTERNTRDPIVLQKSDKGQLFVRPALGSVGCLSVGHHVGKNSWSKSWTLQCPRRPRWRPSDPWVSSVTPLEPLHFPLEFGNNHIILWWLSYWPLVCAVRHVHPCLVLVCFGCVTLITLVVVVYQANLMRVNLVSAQTRFKISSQSAFATTGHQQTHQGLRSVVEKDKNTNGQKGQTYRQELKKMPNTIRKQHESDRIWLVNIFWFISLKPQLCSTLCIKFDNKLTISCSIDNSYSI